MTTNESETPRTDAESGYILDANEEYSQEFKKSRDGEYVPADFARQLERELADAKREIDELRRKVQG